VQRSSGATSGSIYDLGYRPYEGSRLGRAYAIQSLYWYSLRDVFGLGRSIGAKVFPWGLAVIALLPALLQVGIAAAIPEDFELISHAGHFGYISVIVGLFCAVAAPDITGRDQRARTLTLYFSRALSRDDYVIAKVAALITALFLVNFVPQTLLLAGNAIATDDVSGYLQDNADDLLPIIGSSLAISVVLATLSLAIASQSARRAISTIAVLGFLTISLVLSSILVNTLDGDIARYTILLAPMNTLEGLIYWLFSQRTPFESDLREADLSGGVYLLACLAYAGVAVAFLLRRYRKLSV
jgi:ABC-2 type transport system permease protein